MSELCRRFGVSRFTGYKWLERARSGGSDGLDNHSRRPLTSPYQMPAEVVAKVRFLRQENPAWGARKLHHVLRREGFQPLPAASTVNSILRREGLLSPQRRLQRDWQRFEEEAPNDLWQMDFKGPIRLATAEAHALTILDDHSRFNICLAACPDERGETVQTQLVRVFKLHGLPVRMLMDNGPPWGSAGQTAAGSSMTRIAAWLIRLGIQVSHGRPYHPQTQGKDERFHGSLERELLSRCPACHDREELQTMFDRWREVYNFRRPHEAVGDDPPVARYASSHRAFPAVLKAIEYDSRDEVYRVRVTGEISFRGHLVRVSKGLAGEPVALRATGEDTWDIYYCHQRVRRLDLSCPEDV